MPDSQQPGLHVPARFIPTPTSISAAAQAFLSRDFGVEPPKIALSDTAGWRKYVAGVETAMAPMAAMRAQRYPAQVAEHRVAAATLYEVTPDTASPAHRDKAIFHIHGGAFIVGGGRTAASTAQPLASLTGLHSFSIDYRMPPDFPFPHGLNDCLDGYRYLLTRFAPEKIVVEGGSAGANLAAAVILKARDAGLPLPGACILHTAAADLTDSGDTMRTNVVIDVVLRHADHPAIKLYIGGADPKDPYLSPVFGDLKGFPPTFLSSGTRDMLLSPTVMMHRALRRAGREAELHVFEAMPHGGFGGTAPEDQELLGEMVAFVKRHLRM